MAPVHQLMPKAKHNGTTYSRSICVSMRAYVPIRVDEQPRGKQSLAITRVMNGFARLLAHVALNDVHGTSVLDVAYVRSYVCLYLYIITLFFSRACNITCSNHFIFDYVSLIRPRGENEFDWWVEYKKRNTKHHELGVLCFNGKDASELEVLSSFIFDHNKKQYWISGWVGKLSQFP